MGRMASLIAAGLRKSRHRLEANLRISEPERCNNPRLVSEWRGKTAKQGITPPTATRRNTIRMEETMMNAGNAIIYRSLVVAEAGPMHL